MWEEAVVLSLYKDKRDPGKGSRFPRDLGVLRGFIRSAETYVESLVVYSMLAFFLTQE